MKNFISVMCVVCTILIATTSFNENTSQIRFEAGQKFPPVSISNDSTSFVLGETSQSFVLISFWRSSLAESRLACNAYDAFFKNSSSETDGIWFIAINTDKNEDLFHEIVYCDGMNTRRQFPLSDVYGVNTDALRRASSGFYSVLLNRQGDILCFNPSVDYLSSLAL